MRRALGALAALAAVGAGFTVASAQDTPPPEKKEPETKILPEAELQRVRGELLRLETERKRLAGVQVDLEVRARELEKKVAGLPTSPVLNPRTVVVPVTVRDTVRRALGNNPDNLVNALVAEAAQEQQEIERSLFDPTLQSTAQWATTNSPNLSNNTFSGLPVGLSKFRRDDWSFQTSLSELFPTGTRASISYNDGHDVNNNAFAVNPTYGPRLRLDVTQQLLKGFFPNPIDVNLARMRAAESDGEAADALFAQQLMEAALAVENAYWDVVRAEENLKVSESSLKSANELLQDRRKRRELGAGTGLDITIAEAGVAQRRENMIVSENDLETKRDVLIRLTEPLTRADRYDLYLVPVERAEETPAPEEEVAAALQTALARRPDHRRATLQIDSARHQLKSAENNALPQVDFFTFLQEDGIGTSSRSSWSALGSGNFYSAGGGIRVSLPLILRSERAQERQALVNVRRAEATLQALEADIELDVRRSIRNIRTARARIEATHTARLLSVKQLDAIKKEVEFGVALPRQVLDSQTDLDTARSREIQALIDYRVALSTLEKAKGTILDAYADQLPERVKRSFTR